METLLIAEFDKDAIEPWIESKTDYGWMVDRGSGQSYVRWGETVFPCDRLIERSEACCDEEHWYAYRLEKAGQQFYVAGGQALPSYEKVKLLKMTTDHSAYAFAGYRGGQWHVCIFNRFDPIGVYPQSRVYLWAMSKNWMHVDFGKIYKK